MHFWLLHSIALPSISTASPVARQRGLTDAHPRLGKHVMEIFADNFFFLILIASSSKRSRYSVIRYLLRYVTLSAFTHCAGRANVSAHVTRGFELGAKVNCNVSRRRGSTDAIFMTSSTRDASPVMTWRWREPLSELCATGSLFWCCYDVSYSWISEIILKI